MKRWRRKRIGKNSKFVKCSMLPRVTHNMKNLMLFIWACFAFFFTGKPAAGAAVGCGCTERHGLIRSPVNRWRAKHKNKNSCKLTYKSSNSLLIYFISSIYMQFHLFLNIVRFLLCKILLRIFSLLLCSTLFPFWSVCDDAAAAVWCCCFTSTLSSFSFSVLRRSACVCVCVFTRGVGSVPYGCVSSFELPILF